MKPLSKNKRRWYLAFFFLVFIVGAPLFIFDARGYRFNWNGVAKVFQTGGLYISTDQSGIEIYVNRVLVKKTSLVQKSIFVQDLKPGTYEINVSKEGLQQWTKTLKVFPEIVTEARTFLFKTDPELIEIPRFLDSRDIGTTSSRKKIALKNPEYDLINTLFLPPITKTVLEKPATTSPENKALSDLLIKNEDGKLRVFWTGDEDSIPNYFCESSVCKHEITIHAATPILSFDFFPGRNDLLVLRLAGGIFVAEIDDRSPQNVEQIASGSGFDFRIKDGKTIYLKKDGKVYSVSL